MSVFAELSDGRRLEFPDATDPGVIQQTVKKVVGAQQPAQTVQPFPTMRDSLKEAINADPFPLGAKVLGGVGAAVDDAAYGLKQLFGNQLNSQEVARVQGNRDLMAVGGVPAAVGNIAGNLAMTAGPGASLYRGGTAVAKQALPRMLQMFAPTVGGAATGAAIAGATQPVLEGESSAKNMGVGALGGALGDAASRGLARVAQPIMQSPEVKSLLSKGIVPTPGQAAGEIGNRTEQKLTSLPFTGEIIRGGRNRAREEFNKAALNMGMPNGETVSQAGNAGMEEVKGALSRAYDKVFAGKVVQPDQNLVQLISEAKLAPSLPLNDVRQKQFNQVLDKVLWQRIPQIEGAASEISADKLKTEIIGDLGKLASKLQRSPIAEESSLGDALMAARNGVQGWLVNKVAQSNPLVAAQIRKIDPAYANRIMAGKAVDRAAAQGGVFTPYQAIRASRPGTDLRQLAETAQPVIGNSVPNSGTADRGLLTFMSMHPSSFINPAEYVGIPAASLAYSRPGSRYMIGDFPGQIGLNALLRSSAPYTSQMGASFAKSRKQP